MPNPDGTIQVAPPTMSAFGPASASAPPPPAPAAPAPHPGFVAALMQMLSQLGSALNPAVSRAPARTERAIEAQSLGNQFDASGK